MSAARFPHQFIVSAPEYDEKREKLSNHTCAFSRLVRQQ